LGGLVDTNLLIIAFSTAPFKLRENTDASMALTTIAASGRRVYRRT
jgi:hypothetical protein